MLSKLLLYFCVAAPSSHLDLEQINYFNQMAERQQIECIICACEKGAKDQLGFCLEYAKNDLGDEKGKVLFRVCDIDKDEIEGGNVRDKIVTLFGEHISALNEAGENSYD